MSFKMLSILILLITHDLVNTVTNYNDLLASSLQYNDGNKFTFSLKATKYILTNNITSAILAELIPIHLHEEINSCPTELVTVVPINQCDSCTYPDDDDDNDDNDHDDDDEISKKFELLAVAAVIVAAVLVVLLVVTLLLLINLRKFNGKYVNEQLKCVSLATARTSSRAGVEDVPFSQSSCANFVPSQQVSGKAVLSERHKHAKRSSITKSYFRILSKLSATVQINQRLIKLLLSKTDSALESKANATSIENELVQLQKIMEKVKKNNLLTISKWKSRAQKSKMESDHHKRQESYLEDRCEKLRKHNEHMMNFFKTIHKQKAHNCAEEMLTDDEFPYPVQEESPHHQK